MARPSVASVLLWGLVLALSCVGQGARGRKGTGGVDFAKALRIMRNSRDGYVSMDDEQFTRIVLDPGASRDFAVVTIFTVTSSRYGCQGCKEALSSFSEAAKSYLQARGKRPEDQPVLFAMLDFEKAQQAFTAMQLETVPHMYIFKAKTQPSLPPGPAFGAHSSDEILTELKRQTGIDIPPLPDVETTVNVAVAAAALLALLAFLVLDHWEWTKGLPFHRVVWMTASYTIFTLAVGGTVYCIIRRPPLFVPRPEGLQLFATHSGQDQFVGEGLIIGLHYIITALSFIGAYNAVRVKWLPRPLQIIVANVFITSGAYFLSRIFGFYESKTRWYQLSTVLPKPVGDFIFGDVKRHQGLAKRVVRASYLYLYKYKDWPSFRRLLTNLFVKYGKRQLGWGGGK